MDQKITLPRLAAIMAEKGGYSKKACEDYLKAFFSTVSDTLASGESVKIKGLGAFKLTRVEERKSVNVSTGEEYVIPAHDKISFLPAKELAEAVNAPFAIFETVEIDDGPSEETSEPIAEAPAEIESSELSESSDLSEEKAPEESAPEEEPSEQSEPFDLSEEILSEEEVRNEDQVVEEMHEDADEKRRNRKRHFGRGFLVGFGAAVFAMAIGFVLFYIFILAKMETRIQELTAYEREHPQLTAVDSISDSVSSEADEAVATHPSDESGVGETPTAKVEPAAPQQEQTDEKVYDTVSTTRYLTTIAGEHYGDKRLWAVIYKENAAILGHPDRIRPGTKVVVPPLSKYGVDPKNPKDVRKVVNDGAAIYAKYK